MALAPAPSETPALRSQVDPTVAGHADRIIQDLEDARDLRVVSTRDRIRAVWERVACDAQITKEFAGAEIRGGTMRGRVSSRIMELLGDSPDFIQIMSIGDVDLPDFAQPVITDIYERAHRQHMANLAENGTCYDLPSKGLESARSAMVGYFDSSYDFSNVPGLREALIKNACITNGGMRALDDIATGLVTKGQMDHVRPRFIYPDNSFGTWKQIVTLRSSGGKLADLDELPTSQGDGLHLTAQDVSDYYASHSEPERGVMQDTWYITPVGNPSGTKMTPEQLFTTCSSIIEANPQATIILDSVYVRTLPPDQAKLLYAGVVNSPEIMNRVILVESFSKTHGLCGERIGTFMSANQEIFDTALNINMTLSAGNGHFRSAMVQALCDTSADQEVVIQSLHQLWARERKGLYQYLLKRGLFDEIFDDNQSHIRQDDLDYTQGLYLTPKLREGVTVKDVLYATGCLGTEVRMGSGRYIRFSVGKMTKSNFARYVDDEVAPSPSTQATAAGESLQTTL